MTVAAPEAYRKRLQHLSDDELHAEGFEIVKAMRGESDGRAFTASDQMVLLCDELCRRDQHITRQRIVDVVAALTDVSAEHMMGRGKSARVVAARQVAMWAIRERMRLSLTNTGDFFGRDHSTVLHALRRVESDPELRQLAEQALSCGVRPR